MEKAVDDALAAYTGDELRIGVLSSFHRHPGTERLDRGYGKEPQRPCYQEKVSPLIWTRNTETTT